MASIDVIDASGKSYRQVWQERAYLLRLAAGPLLIKLTCHMTVIALGWETDFVRQALVMLPSYFADGWMLAHFVRLIFLDQRWPFRPSGNRDDDVKRLQNRAQGVMAGMVAFALIKFLLAGIAHFAYQASVFESVAKGSTTPEPSLPMVMGAVILLLAGMWAFRLLWLYIPAALGYSLRRFIRDIKGFATSIYMMGVWLVSFVPVLAVFGLVISLFFAPLDIGDGASVPAGIEFTLSILRVLMDTLVAILATAGICHGVKAIMESGRKLSR